MSAGASESFQRQIIFSLDDIYAMRVAANYERASDD
jgi:hypothetical protein